MILLTSNCNQSGISNRREIHSKPVCKIPCSQNYTHWYLHRFVHILHKGISSPWQSRTVRSTAMEVLPSHIFPIVLSFGAESQGATKFLMHLEININHLCLQIYLGIYLLARLLLFIFKTLVYRKESNGTIQA